MAKVKWSKRLSLTLASDARSRVGALAIRLVRERVDGRGLAANGHRLPPLEGEYSDEKRAAGGKPWRGGSKTGAMWRSLKALVQGTSVRLVFVGGENGKKAAALQYGQRGGKGARVRLLTLLELSRDERRQLAREVLSQVRIFR